MSLYLYDNLFDNGFKVNSIMLISILSIISGILVVISKNPVISVLFLILLFFTIALYLFRLDISFIALAYLLVYVGAVSILFLFILMLINVRISELITENNNGVPLSVIIIAIFSMSFSEKALFYNENTTYMLNIYDFKDEKDMFPDIDFLSINLPISPENNENSLFVFSCMWDNIIGEMSHIVSLGNIIYTSYSLAIIIVGLILLLSMVGAISITATSNNKV